MLNSTNREARWSARFMILEIHHIEPGIFTSSKHSHQEIWSCNSRFVCHPLICQMIWYPPTSGITAHSSKHSLLFCFASNDLSDMFWLCSSCAWQHSEKLSPCSSCPGGSYFQAAFLPPVLWVLWPIYSVGCCLRRLFRVSLCLTGAFPFCVCALDLHLRCCSILPLGGCSFSLLISYNSSSSFLYTTLDLSFLSTSISNSYRVTGSIDPPPIPQISTRESSTPFTQNNRHSDCSPPLSTISHPITYTCRRYFNHHFIIDYH